MDIESLVVGARRRELIDGEVLVAEGDQGADVFVVIEGGLDVVRSVEPDEITVATLGPGELAGEVTHTMGGHRSATLRARGATAVAIVDRDGFVDWLDAHPDDAAAIADDARLRRNRTRAAAALTRFLGSDHAGVVEQIVDRIDWVTLHPGDILFEQDDSADAAYLVVAGRLHVHATDGDGLSALDVELGRGELIGELGILNDTPRSATARAIRDTTLARLSRASFDILSEQYPRLLLQVSLRIIDRLRREHVPDHRARVMALAVTAPVDDGAVAAISDELRRFGTTLVVDEAELRRRVRDLDGPGGLDRAAEYIHEADVTNDYVLLVDHGAPTRWSSTAAKQCDRFIGIVSADPSAEELRQLAGHLDALPAEVRAGAWLVRVHPASAPRPAGTAAVMDRFGVAEVHNVRSGRESDLQRTARLMSGNGRGLVLAGGGAKGMAHVGAMTALRDADLAFDRIGGTSMGALMAALGADDLDDDAMAATVRSEFHRKLFRPTLPLVGILSGERIAKSLLRQADGRDLLDTWIPLFAVSTNLTRSTLTVHRRGPMAQALRASSSLPVILPPVPIDLELHVDGAVLDNLPAAVLANDPSIATTFACDVSPSGGPASPSDYGLHISGRTALWSRLRHRSLPSPSIGQTLMSSMVIGSTRAFNEAVAAVDCFIQLDASDVGLLQYENHEKVIAAGRADAETTISEWLDARTDVV